MFFEKAKHLPYSFNDPIAVEGSEGMPLAIERFRRKDFGHIEAEIAIDDPQAYTKPWSFPLHFLLLSDTELIESVCENEKDAAHAVGK